MAKSSIFRVLQKAELLSILSAARSEVSPMGKIPADVLEILKAEQKVEIVRSRLKVCKAFQAALEVFWKQHYDKKMWDLTVRKDPVLAVLVGDAYKALSRADFNVSHEGNRDLDHLERFLKGIDRKEMPIEYTVKWAMMSASSMPSTFLSAYDVYTGRTEIDIRPFFPDLDFSEAEEPKRY